MELYELINYSDNITFRAADDNVAFFVVLILGEGKLGCHKADGTNIQTMFYGLDPTAEIEKRVGKASEKWAGKNHQNMVESFRSFQYTTLEGRELYEFKLSKCANEMDRITFQQEWEDQHRSSMNRIVRSAWNIGDQLAKQTKEVADGDAV